ncbi:MAG: hypothetical protein ACRDJ1_10360, partial [Actinomycetota bacterium]
AALRRRSLLILLVFVFTVFGMMSYASFSDLRSQRNLIGKAERGELHGFEIFELRISTFCDGSTCFIGDENGESLGIEFPQPEFGPGKPIPGPTEIPPEIQALEGRLPELATALRGRLDEKETTLSPRWTLREHLRAAGTFWGVLFAVFAGATLLGAEWRWGVWRTLLTHEPRRGRVLLTRFGMLWSVIALGFILTMAFTAGTDSLFRAMSDVGATGGPEVAPLARVAGRSLLSVEIYATFAGALATIVRTSFAGIGSLGLLLGDGLFVERFNWLRHYSPAQQVARLIPASEDTDVVVWWHEIRTGASSCRASPDGGFLCEEKLLTPIPQWRAIVVILAWIAVVGLITAVFVKRRDVPQ